MIMSKCAVCPAALCRDVFREVTVCERDKGWGKRFIHLAMQLSQGGLELHTHQENHAARSHYERRGFKAVRFRISPPPESTSDVEYH